MAAQWRLCVLLFLLGAVAVHCNEGADSEEKAAAAPAKEEDVQDVLTRNVNEVYDIVMNDDAPITRLKNRYKNTVVRGAQGFVVGALAGKVISTLALSIIKTAVFGGIMFGVAVFCGVGADYDRLNDVYASGQIVANRLMRYFDINKDGKYDMEDAKEVWKRVEKVLLSYNLARSLGGIAGMALGLVF